MYVFTAAKEQFVEAAVGTKVILPCKTDQNGSIVIWKHYPFGAILSNIVFLNGAVFEKYRGKVTVNTGSRVGEFNLTVLRVNLEDSGQYTCTTGKLSQSLELIVLGKYGSIA